MITFGLNYDVKPEHLDQFISVSNEVLKLMDTLDGHERTVLYRDVNKDNSFMIYSDWESDEAFHAFIKSDAFKEVKTVGRDILENRPSHKIYERKQFGR